MVLKHVEETCNVVFHSLNHTDRSEALLFEQMERESVLCTSRSVVSGFGLGVRLVSATKLVGVCHCCCRETFMRHKQCPGLSRRNISRWAGSFQL